MTVAAESRRSALALELIRPFTESEDARLRGNAVVALATLIDSENRDLSEPARDELVRVLCAEPGSQDMDWQRRFTTISVAAICQLSPQHSEPIGAKVFEQLARSREPAQHASIARLILAACDRGRLPWPIGWRQFRRCAALAGRPSFWLGVWAALWRSAIAWAVMYLGANMLDLVTGKEDRFSEDDLFEYSLFLAISSAVALGIIIKLSVPGNVRPPRRVYVMDIVLSALAGGLFVPLGTLFMLPHWHSLLDELDLLRLSGIFVFGTLVIACVRSLRWANDFVALEPDEYGNVVRPAAALGLSALACVAVAYLGMDAEIAAATFVVLVPAAAVLASLDIWLEDKGPRSLLPAESIVERRWVLPVVAGASVLGLATFFYSNLRAEPVNAASSENASKVEISSDQPPETADARMGQLIEFRVAKEGDFDILGDGDGSILVFDASQTRIYPSGQYWHLTTGTYRACLSDRGDVCVGRTPESLLDHVVWSFGLFDRARPATLTFVPVTANEPQN